MPVLYIAGLALVLLGCFLGVWKRRTEGLLLIAGGDLALALERFFEGSLALGIVFTVLAGASLIVWAWIGRNEAV